MELRSFVLGCIVLIVGLKATHAMFAKRKMCVEYRISNSHRNASFLGVIHDKSESGCLQQCGRRPECNAYNYLRKGACQLLRRTGDCHEPDELDGSLFVHLADCSGGKVWQVDSSDRNINAQCLIWHRSFQNSVNCPQEILRGPGKISCAGVGVNKGLYLPCWFNNGKFRMISENGAPLRCDGNGGGYLLQVRPNCSSTWQDYTVGDPIPAHAAQVGVWKDGNPLYMVAARIGAGRIGYYLPSAKRTFILKYITQSPESVLMLIIKRL